MKNTRIIDLCNFAKRFVVDECGVVGDMIALYDRDGDETDNMDEALTAAVRWRDDHTFSPINLTDFERLLLH